MKEGFPKNRNNTIKLKKQTSLVVTQTDMFRYIRLYCLVKKSTKTLQGEKEVPMGLIYEKNII